MCDPSFERSRLAELLVHVQGIEVAGKTGEGNGVGLRDGPSRSREALPDVVVFIVESFLLIGHFPFPLGDHISTVSFQILIEYDGLQKL